MNQQENEKLIGDLIAERVEPRTAARLVREAPDICRRQLSYLDYQDDLSDTAATLVASIEGDWPEPARSYWENAIQRAADEKPSEEEPSEAEPQIADDVQSVTDEAEEADEDVRNLLSALENIAVMSHAHRDDRSTPCPVCVAWDALKQWAHRKSLRGE